MHAADATRDPGRLPLVISVPHGGKECPPELDDANALGARDLFDDSDAFTNSIYDLTGSVEHVSVSRIARAYVDLNRAPDDLPPQNPDGVIKSATDHEVPIYAPGREPDAITVRNLLAKYHRPYHEGISAAAARSSVLAGLDCHSMEPHPPPVAPDANDPRPMFCLSNGEGVTAPDDMLQALRQALATAFELQEGSIALNKPFKGGWIVRSHAKSDPIPWIQVEMNRSLYLSEPWFDRAALTVDESRIADLNSRFARALVLFAADIAQDQRRIR